LLISIHCYILFDMSYVFTCRAHRPLDSDRRSFLGCCMVRRRLTWSMRLRWSKRLRWRWRLTWSRQLTWSRTVRRTTVRRRV
jgi:hypothetical protein